jgi:hypothetical protein
MKLGLVILGLTLSTGLAGVALADGPTDEFIADMTDMVAAQQEQALQLADVTQDNANLIADSLQSDVDFAGPFLAMLQGGADPAALIEALTADPAGAIGAYPDLAQQQTQALQDHAADCFAAYAAAANEFAQEQAGMDVSPVVASALQQCQVAQGYQSDPAASAQALLETFAVPGLPPL